MQLFFETASTLNIAAAVIVQILLDHKACFLHSSESDDDWLITFFISQGMHNESGMMPSQQIIG